MIDWLLDWDGTLLRMEGWAERSGIYHYDEFKSYVRGEVTAGLTKGFLGREIWVGGQDGKF